MARDFPKNLNGNHEKHKKQIEPHQPKSPKDKHSRRKSQLLQLAKLASESTLSTSSTSRISNIESRMSNNEVKSQSKPHNVSTCEALNHEVRIHDSNRDSLNLVSRRRTSQLLQLAKRINYNSNPPPLQPQRIANHHHIRKGHKHRSPHRTQKTQCGNRYRDHIIGKGPK